MSNGKSSNQRGYSKKDRIIAQIMVLLLTVSMMPYQTLAAAAAETKRVKSVEEIQTEYEVENGTSKDEIGLPSSLSVVIETTQSADGKTKEEPSRTEEEVREDILWDGDYDGDSAGTYELEARFKDKKLAYEDMPVVHVTVREPEPEPEPEQNDSITVYITLSDEFPYIKIFSILFSIKVARSSLASSMPPS